MSETVIVYRQQFIFILTILICSNASILAERLPVRTYTVADGLLRDNVTRIRQDSRGFLWFCTPEGISRFDGQGFTNFRTDDGLPDRHANDFLETRSGTIYIATDNGLARLNPKGIRGSPDDPLFTVFLPDRPDSKSFNVLFEDKNGRAWAGTSDGLYEAKEIDGNVRLESITLDGSLAGSLPITGIIQDRGGTLWIGTNGHGLYRLFPSGLVEHYTDSDGLPVNSVASLLENSNGQIWVGFRDIVGGGVVRLVDEPSPGRSVVAQSFTTRDGLPSGWVPELFQSKDGKFWVGTTQGLCLWQNAKDNVCKTYTEQNDLCLRDIWSITEDKDGNLWTGSPCGAKKITRYGFTTYDKADGLGDTFTSIFENRKGDLFVSSLGKQFAVSRFDGNRFVSSKLNVPNRIKYFGWGWKQTVWQDSENDWWVPTGEGLFRFANVKNFADLSTSRAQEAKTGARGKDIFRLFEDARGDIWVAIISNPPGLMRWERKTNIWHDHAKDVGFLDKNIQASVFLEDRRGNLWIGTGSDAGESGLIRYRDGKFRVFGKADGAPPGWTRDLFLDHLDHLWIANTTWGLLRLDDLNSDNLSFTRYTPAEGLSSIGVYCVTEDDFGRIYAGTGRGLDRLDPQTGQIENFTTADGLPDSDVEVAFRDRRNALWFSTNKGLARFQPEPLKQRSPPVILITGLRVSGESQRVSIMGESEIPGLDLDSDKGQISLDFLGLGATLGEKLRYEYRLTGGDWTETREHTVNFANLSSGNYHFEIRARTADGILSRDSARVSFSIAAPMWQRWWFIALVTSLVVLAIYIIYRNRLARLLEMERMRIRIATDLHDDIGANLTRISLMSEVATQQASGENVRGLLPSIADIARESVASMNDIVWAISPKHDTLVDLTRRMRQHAEEVFVLRDIGLRFNVPQSDAELKLGVDVRRDLLLIFKEAVSNAARHSGCSNVRIDMFRKNSHLILEVADDGRGFDMHSEKNGHGVRSLQRRAENLGGVLTIESGNGTTVRLVLPL